MDLEYDYYYCTVSSVLYSKTRRLSKKQNKTIPNFGVVATRASRQFNLEADWNFRLCRRYTLDT